VIEIGEAGIEVLHTPGHAPEHISLLARRGRPGVANVPGGMTSWENAGYPRTT